MRASFSDRSRNRRDKMKAGYLWNCLGALGGLMLGATVPAWASDEIVIGFATAQSGFLQAVDGDELKWRSFGLSRPTPKAACLASSSRPCLRIRNPTGSNRPRLARLCLTKAPPLSWYPATMILAHPLHYKRNRPALSLSRCVRVIPRWVCSCRPPLVQRLGCRSERRRRGRAIQLGRQKI